MAHENLPTNVVTLEDRLYDNFAAIQRSQQRLDNRRRKLERQFRELEAISASDEADTSFLELWSSTRHAARGACLDLHDYTRYLDEELHKLNAGLDDYENLYAGAGKQALLQFMLTDTEISVRNINRTCDFYKDFIDSLDVLKKQARAE